MIDLIRSKLDTGTTVYDLANLRMTVTPFMALDIETYGADDLPGDSPYSARHGIAGIAVGNMHGDAVYIVVNDGKQNNGIPIDQAIQSLNVLFSQCKVVALHYSKFDLGFLIKRGLKLNARIVDTWMLHSIKSCGVYSSNALKDITRTELKIDTSTETVKDDWMEANKTRDYGRVPVELLARYAYNDTRYTLLVLLTLFTGKNELTEADWANHDLYVRNNLNLIAAEDRGIALDIPLVKDYLDRLRALIVKDKAAVIDALGATELDPEDEQKMLAYMHSKNLHPAPRQQFGELKYVYDNYFLRSVEHPLVDAYSAFHTRTAFVKGFSALKGDMGHRFWMTDNGEAGFNASFVPNVFSKGGSVICKAPDITDKVNLDNVVRKLFIPRKKHTFTLIRASNLPMQLIAFYCNNKEMQNMSVDTALLFKAFKHLLPDFEPDAISIMVLQLLNGFGINIMSQFFTVCGMKADNKAIMGMRDKFRAKLHGYKAMQERLEGALKETGEVKDRHGRVLRIPEAERYKALGTLVKSSTGSLLSVHLDMFSRLARETGAHLVMAHGPEFIFEVPDANQTFNQALPLILEKNLSDPKPHWKVQEKQACWSCSELDLHNVALERL
jgi:hypothetical protein